MKGFPGFPAGKLRVTRIPSLFFSDLLPAIDTLAELKVTLYCFWLSGRRPNLPPYVRWSELRGDDGLLAGLAEPERNAEEALRDGLERAVARGTLIHVVTQKGEQVEDWYFLNTESGRAAVERLRLGDWSDLAEAAPTTVRLAIERPNIFVLYEQNIGLLQPLIAEELREAERRYPAAWIEEAFGEAVRLNKRNWRYVRAILERWATEGKGDGKRGEGSAADRRRYASGKYADLIEH